MKMFIFALWCLLALTGATAGPQFGSFGIPKVPAADLIPNAENILEWPNRIQELVELTRTVLTGMGEVALSDNPEVGPEIVSKLNEEILKVTKIFADFTAKTVTGRSKRDVDGNGKDAYEDVGKVLVGSNNKIEGDKKKLSPGAQKKINKKHREGVEKCGADSCKAAAKLLKDTDEGERQ